MNVVHSMFYKFEIKANLYSLSDTTSKLKKTASEERVDTFFIG